MRHLKNTQYLDACYQTVREVIQLLQYHQCFILWGENLFVFSVKKSLQICTLDTGIHVHIFFLKVTYLLGFHNACMN